MKLGRQADISVGHHQGALPKVDNSNVTAHACWAASSSHLQHRVDLRLPMDEGQPLELGEPGRQQGPAVVALESLRCPLLARILPTQTLMQGDTGRARNKTTRSPHRLGMSHSRLARSFFSPLRLPLAARPTSGGDRVTVCQSDGWEVASCQ